MKCQNRLSLLAQKETPEAFLHGAAIIQVLLAQSKPPA
jgi:hypothetical protein